MTYKWSNSINEYLNNTSKEVLKKEWDEVAKYNFNGPTVEEYFKFLDSFYFAKAKEPEPPLDFSYLAQNNLTPSFSGSFF